MSLSHTHAHRPLYSPTDATDLRKSSCPGTKGVPGLASTAPSTLVYPESSIQVKGRLAAASVEGKGKPAACFGIRVGLGGVGMVESACSKEADSVFVGYGPPSTGGRSPRCPAPWPPPGPAVTHSWG